MGETEDGPLYRFLATRYDDSREAEALDILTRHPEIAALEWDDPAFEKLVMGSTPLHYAANDGRIQLMARLIDLGADPNVCNAQWYATPLSWAANNARVEAIRFLLDHGTDIHGLHALHAVAWGGSSCGKSNPSGYVETIRLLLDRGADINDVRRVGDSPLTTALKSGNDWVAEVLRERGALEISAGSG
jgi:ankyrin repeat protein